MEELSREREEGGELGRAKHESSIIYSLFFSHKGRKAECVSERASERARSTYTLTRQCVSFFGTKPICIPSPLTLRISKETSKSRSSSLPATSPARLYGCQCCGRGENPISVEDK